MGTITEIKGKFRAQIRKKGNYLNCLFSSKELAEIWIKYHEELIQNMSNFNLPAEKILTLEQACNLKIEDLKEKNVTKKSIQDIENISLDFNEIINIPIGDINPDMIRDISKKMLNGLSKRGGRNDGNLNTGIIANTSPATVLRKLRGLSSVFGYMIENGANIQNPACVVVNQVKMSLIKKGESVEDEQ